MLYQACTLCRIEWKTDWKHVEENNHTMCAALLRFLSFLDVAQHSLVVCYQHFKTTCQFCLQESFVLDYLTLEDRCSLILFS
jgi:hypothetical protein